MNMAGKMYPYLFTAHRGLIVCFGYNRKTSSQLYEKYFDKDKTKKIKPVQPFRTGTVTTVLEDYIQRERDIHLRKAMQRQGR